MPTHAEAMQRWPVVSRAQAHKQGLKRYWTGKACKQGHNEQRAVSSGICCACNRMYAAKFRNASTVGFESLRVECHPDDMETVRQFVAGINTVRELHASAPAVAPPDMTAARVAVFPELAAAPPGYVPPKAVLR